MNITESIERVLNVLENRPLMIFSGDRGYYSYKVYVEGFLFGISTALGLNIILNITLWYRERLDKDMDVYFTDYIPIHYKTKTEDELKAILVDTLKEYFEQNPNWNKAD